MMSTREFYIRVENRTPIVFHLHDGAPSADQIKRYDLSYWALGADAYDDWPSVLMHIYVSGPLPSEARRDQINSAVKDYVGRLLMEERDGNE